MTYSPDGIERSRASANCAGSHLHSTWWQQAAMQSYSTTFGPLSGIAKPGQQGLGGLMGGLGGQSLGQLGNPLGNPFGKP